MEIMRKVIINIKDIKHGDTVIINNILLTVGKKDIKHGGFMGSSLFGDSSKRQITKCLFIVPTNKETI